VFSPSSGTLFRQELQSTMPNLARSSVEGALLQQYINVRSSSSTSSVAMTHPSRELHLKSGFGAGGTGGHGPQTAAASKQQVRQWLAAPVAYCACLATACVEADADAMPANG
jgi:hypothetical protein